MNKRLIYIVAVLIVAFIGWRIYQYQQLKESLPDRMILIQAGVDYKLAEYAGQMRENCNTQMLKEARLIADSIAFLKADSLMLFDTTSRPPKPGKPVVPERLPLKDSLQIAPLIPLENDSLN